MLGRMMFFGRLSEQATADALEVDKRTVRKWRTGRGGCPVWALVVVRNLITDHEPHLAPPLPPEVEDPYVDLLRVNRLACREIVESRITDPRCIVAVHRIAREVSRG